MMLSTGLSGLVTGFSAAAHGEASYGYSYSYTYESGPSLKCDPDFKDYEGFDCLLYTGANWCTKDGLRGPGWCATSEYPPAKNAGASASGCLVKATKANNLYWDPIVKYHESYDAGTLALKASALHECAGCGGSCPHVESKRTPNAVAPSCVDHTDGEGHPWRDGWGYTCDAYRYGNFCQLGPDGKWTEGGLWDKSFGKIKNYAWWADGGKKLDGFDACCACGGGSSASTTIAASAVAAAPLLLPPSPLHSASEPIRWTLGTNAAAVAHSGNASRRISSTATPACSATLAFPHCKQVCGMWCWATVVAEVAAFYAGASPQCGSDECKVVSHSLGTDCCSATECSGACGQGASVSQIQKELSRFHNFSYEAAALDEASLVAQLQGGRPVLRLTSGHIDVVTGCKDGVYQLTDSEYDSVITLPYSELVQSPYNPQAKWVGTFVTSSMAALVEG